MMEKEGSLAKKVSPKTKIPSDDKSYCRDERIKSKP